MPQSSFRKFKTKRADLLLTERLKEAGKLLDMPIEDHLIITNEDGYYSFADDGLL